MTYILLLCGLLLLFFGGDKLVEGAVALARRLGLSPLLIGLTLVGFGTSTPELLTSLLAVSRGSNGIAVGNVVGSNIANILLVLGVAAVIRPVQVSGGAFRRDSVVLAISSLMLLFGFILGQIPLFLGAIMVCMLIGYVYYSYQSDKKHQKQVLAEMDLPKDEPQPLWRGLVWTVGGLLLTMLGAKLLVDNSIILARSWGVRESVIGLTIVAVGTSLPELATSIVASIKGHNDVAFGNVVGSNIYNALFILGMTALFMPIQMTRDMLPDLGWMMGVTALLIMVAFRKHQFSKLMGWVFLLLYGIYIAYLGMNS